MGIRFRKRAKILPGVTLNFSKTGISTTIGKKGASINIGKKGTYANMGIPGTGIYSRKKTSSAKPNTRKQRKQEFKERYPQQELFDVPPEQIEQTSTKESIIGCLSVVIALILAIWLGIKFDSILLSIIILIVPFIYIFFSNKQKKDETNNVLPAPAQPKKEPSKIPKIKPYHKYEKKRQQKAEKTAVQREEKNLTN